MNRGRRRKLQQERKPYPEGYNSKRGKEYFFVALTISLVMIALRFVFHGPVPILNAAFFVILFSVAAGIIGTFTNNVPF